MNQIDTGLWKNISASELLKLGAGSVAGLIIEATSSGVFKLLDGVDNTAGARATSTLTTSGIVYAKFPESTLTSDATNVADGATVVIGSITYRFKDTMLAAYDVQIGASAAISLDNLKAAINATGTPGTEYFAGTLIHPDVTATTNTDTTQKVVSKVIGTANNTKATTETSSHLSWADTTLGGGTGTSVTGVATASSTFVIDGQTYYFTNQLSETVNGASGAVANEILWVTSDAVALDNMKLAINGTGTEGTDYSTGTNAHPSVIATTNGNTTQVIEAKVFGANGNNITTTETMTTTAWTGTTLSGGTDKAETIVSDITLAAGIHTFPKPLAFKRGLFFVLVSGTMTVTPVWN